jgi:iron complex outermembrane recepter protein
VNARIVALAAGLAVVCVGPAAAAQQLPLDTAVAVQDTASVPSPTSDTARPRGLENVVITALRLPTELGSATHAAARNGPDVTRRARPGLALTEPLHGIPGVQVENRYNFSLGERIAVRGFGARTQFGIRGVRVLVDGIPATMPDGQTTLNHLDLGAIQSVEVVRSPVAAIHGNAAGGIISLATLPPPAASFAVGTRMVSGSHGLLRRQLEVGGTTEIGGYRLHVGRLDYSGFRAHNSANNRYVSARTTTELGTAEIGINVHQVRFEALNPGALPDSLVRADAGAAFPTNVAQRTGQTGRHSQGGVTLRQSVGPVRLSTAAYGIRRSFENPILPRIIDLSRRAGGLLATIGSAPERRTRVRWDVGVENAVQRDDRLNHTNVAGERGALMLDQEEEVRVQAVFGALSAEVSPRVTLLAGLRHDDTRFDVRDGLISDANPDDSGEREMRAWSPALGISARLTDDIRVFANIGSAFETPTTTELANRPEGAGGFNPELEPQRTRSHEVGINGFSRSRYYQFALYRSRVKGSLVPFEVPGTPGRQFFRNAGRAEHRGAELMLGGALTAGVSVRAAYTFTDARYDEYTVGGTSYAGRRIPGVAPHRLETLLRFQLARASLDIESRYQGSMAVNDANTAKSGAYALHGLRVGFPLLRWSGFSGAPYFGADNLLDRSYITAVTVNAAAGRFYEPGPGRTVFVGLDLSLESIR